MSHHNQMRFNKNYQSFLSCGDCVRTFDNLSVSKQDIWLLLNHPRLRLTQVGQHEITLMGKIYSAIQHASEDEQIRYFTKIKKHPTYNPIILLQANTYCGVLQNIIEKKQTKLARLLLFDPKFNLESNPHLSYLTEHWNEAFEPRDDQSVPQTLLHYAAQHYRQDPNDTKSIEIVRMLIDKKIPINALWNNQTALDIATNGKTGENNLLIQLLRKNGAQTAAALASQSQTTLPTV